MVATTKMFITEPQLSWKVHVKAGLPHHQVQGLSRLVRPAGCIS